MNDPAPVDRAPIGIVGNGRLAHHMNRYLKLERLPVRRWWRGREETPTEALDGCEVVWVLITDAAIEPFLTTAGLDPLIRIHASGSLVTSLAWGMHPLCTFGPDGYEHEFYRRVPFVCEAGSPSFGELFPELSNPEYQIATRDRALYHAACVLGGNGSMILWQSFFEILERLGLPRSAGTPYLEKTSENLVRLGREALTGPLARGDRGTIRANLAALGDDPLAAVYRSLARTIDPDLLEADA
jgi:hypothetical protein